MKRLLITTAYLFLTIHLVFSSRLDMVLLEAESFQDVGGWEIDAQFIDQMGSSFLLAHGLGKPVKNAKTEVVFPSTGQYKIYVRTRDWVAPHGPGEFQILVNGKAIDSKFGTKGDGEWFWQKGGEITVRKIINTIEL